jgi:hypothetical protein
LGGRINAYHRWMLREADRCGILLNFEAVKKLIPPDTPLPHLEGSELVDWLAKEDFSQAANGYSPLPFHDSLTLWWWPLEVIPLRTRNYTAKGAGVGHKVRCANALLGTGWPFPWSQGLIAHGRMNFGGGRQMIPGQQIHKSVLKELGKEYFSKSLFGVSKQPRPYRPAAKMASGMPTWDEIANGRGAFDHLFVD